MAGSDLSGQRDMLIAGQPGRLVSRTRCCDSDGWAVVVAYDADTSWNEIRCDVCGLRPARTYNVVERHD